MESQLKELITLQREQNELLKRHLWRLKFSLLTLLLLITAMCIGLGLIVYWQAKPAPAQPGYLPISINTVGPPVLPGSTVPVNGTYVAPMPTYQPIPAGASPEPAPAASADRYSP